MERREFLTTSAAAVLSTGFGFGGTTSVGKSFTNPSIIESQIKANIAILLENQIRANEENNVPEELRPVSLQIIRNMFKDSPLWEMIDIQPLILERGLDVQTTEMHHSALVKFPLEAWSDVKFSNLSDDFISIISDELSLELTRRIIHDLGSIGRLSSRKKTTLKAIKQSIQRLQRDEPQFCVASPEVTNILEQDKSFVPKGRAGRNFADVQLQNIGTFNGNISVFKDCLHPSNQLLMGSREKYDGYILSPYVMCLFEKQDAFHRYSIGMQYGRKWCVQNDSQYTVLEIKE